MTFGYQQLYANGLNSNSQIRRSADFIYQRGATYEVVLTGDTLQTAIELVVDMYSNDKITRQLAIVPYDTSLYGGTYTYKFNIRPYQYLSNCVNTEHYQYYWLNDWYSTTQQINWNNPYPNINKVNFKYGYRYINNGTQYYEPVSGSTPTTTFNGLLNDFSLFQNDYHWPLYKKRLH